MTEQEDKGAIQPEESLGVFDVVLMVIALFGFLLVSIGAWMIYKPAGLIVAGVLLLAAAVKGASE